MNKKSLLLIEIIWVILGIVCLGIAIREISANGIKSGLLYLVMAAGAFVLAWIRDSQRKKL
ncbi:MAG: hypothetical protein IH592_11200 [Bacteroidales bacterium]|nr:hypothetical protein [Bacteroidales bacterium]